MGQCISAESSGRQYHNVTPNQQQTRPPTPRSTSSKVSSSSRSTATRTTPTRVQAVELPQLPSSAKNNNNRSVNSRIVQQVPPQITNRGSVPGHSDAFRLAAALSLQGRLEEAVAAFRVAIVHEPTNADAYLALGSLLMMLGRRNEALVPLHMALRLNPNDADVRELVELV